jgi:hypothetical protein
MRQPSSDQVFHSTSILTARNGTIRYFRSPDEVPQELQREIDRVLQGDLTANIILADEGGQKYLQSRGERKLPVTPDPDLRRLWVRRLFSEAAGVLALALALWLLAAGR